MADMFQLNEAQMRWVEPYFPLSCGRAPPSAPCSWHPPVHPGRSGRVKPIRHGKQLYRQRHKVEIMFGRLKDWRRIHTRYDRCAHTFMGTITLAAIVLFWLPSCESWRRV